MSTNYEDTCVSCQCPLKKDSSRRDFNNQVYKSTHSIDVSQPPSLAIPDFSPLLHE